MFKFCKKEKTGIDFFLLGQNLLIERINEDTATWQNALKFVEEKYGHNDKAFDFINAFAFYRLSFLDIALLFKNFLTTKADLEKKIYAKMLVLNLYEFLEDIPQIFGKDFKDSLSILNNNELLDEFRNIKIDIQKIKSESHTYLKEIRNTVVGHKDHNTFIQVAVLDKIDFNEIETYCLTIYNLYLSLDTLEKKIRKITISKINGN